MEIFQICRYMRQGLGYKPKKTNILWLQPSLALQKSWFLYKQYWSIILTAFDQFIIYFQEKKVLVTVAIFLFMSGAFSMQYYFHILFKREKYIASLLLLLKKLIFKLKQSLEFPVKNCPQFFFLPWLCKNLKIPSLIFDKRIN